MDIQSYRAFDPAATTRVVLPKVGLRLCEALDLFLGYVSRFDVAEPGGLRTRLKQRLETQADGATPPNGTLGFTSEHADRDSDLFASLLSFGSATLDVDASAWESHEETEVPKTKLTAVHHLLQYIELTALSDLLGKDPGIEAMKRYLDWTIEKCPPDTSGPKTIAEMRGRDIPWNLNDKGQDAVSALVSEHQLLKKVTACRIHQVLAPFGDEERMEIIACYPDHASIRRSNPSFVLTRTQTLIGGFEYCDTCFHDRRHVSDFEHPSLETFDALTYA